MRMDNDLISRSALKKVLEDAYEEYDGYDPHDLGRFAERVDEEIDNAPTVEVKPFVKVTFDKEELNRIVGERVIKAIENGELVITSKWIPVSEKLPKERINPNTNDFEFVMCSTIWDDVRFYKFGKPIGENKAHFWDYGSIMDEYIIAWMYLPESYKETNNE